MIKFEDIKLVDLLPSNFKNDKTILAITKSLEKPMEENIRLRKTLDFMTRIDSISNENLLDALAYQFHVDFYDYRLDIQSKRNMIKTSIAIHKKKGTYDGLQNALKNMFPTAEIEEWFNYSGEPYHFKVNIFLKDNQLLDVDNISSIYELINHYKNTRSWLEYLMFYRASNILIEENYSKLNVKFNISGETKTRDNKVHSNTENITVDEEYISIKNIFNKIGDTKSKDTESMVSKEKLDIESEYIKIIHDYPIAGDYICGGGIL